MSATAQAVADIVNERSTKTWGPRKERSCDKIFWNRGYNNRSEAIFKEHMRVDRATFQLMLNNISANIYKTPTNMEPNSLVNPRQLDSWL